MRAVRHNDNDDDDDIYLSIYRDLCRSNTRYFIMNRSKNDSYVGFSVFLLFHILERDMCVVFLRTLQAVISMVFSGCVFISLLKNALIACFVCESQAGIKCP